MLIPIVLSIVNQLEWVVIVTGMCGYLRVCVVM